MASDLPNLISLIGNISELGKAKSHIFNAARETLLAIQSVVDVANKHAVIKPDEKSQVVNVAFRSVQKVINTALDRIPHEEKKCKHDKKTGKPKGKSHG